MTTLTRPYPTAAPSAVAPRARFWDLIAAEWIKMWSLRSTYWVLGLGALAVIGFDANAALADYNNWPAYSAAMRANFNPLFDAFPQGSYLFLMMITASVGALAIVTEYSSGLVSATFAAVPNRRAVVAAKIVVVTAVMTVVGAVIAATSFFVTQAILSGRHAGYSIGHPHVLRAIVAATLLAPVCALIGLGFGAMIRHTATTIVTNIVVLLLIPTFLLDRRRWEADIHHALPYNAWLTLVHPYPPRGLYPPTITGSWIVFGAWSLVAATVAIVVVHRRDV